MSLLANGTDIRELRVNGITAAFRALYANGVLVWRSFNGEILYDEVQSIFDAESHNNFYRHSTPVHFFASTNDSTPLANIAGNKENASATAVDWFLATNQVYGSSWNIRQWRSGNLIFDITAFKMTLVSPRSAPLVDASPVDFYADGIRVISTTLAEMKSLGFTVNYRSNGNKYYPSIASSAPNTAFEVSFMDIEYEGPIGGPGDATVESWISLLLSAQTTNLGPIDRGITMNTEGGVSHTIYNEHSGGDEMGFDDGVLGTITPTTVPTPGEILPVKALKYIQSSTKFVVTMDTPALDGVNLRVWHNNTPYELGVGDGTTGGVTTWEVIGSPLGDVLFNNQNTNIDFRLDFYGVPNGTRIGIAGDLTVGVDGSNVGWGCNLVVANPYGSIDNSDRSIHMLTTIDIFQTTPSLSYRVAVRIPSYGSATAWPSKAYLQMNGQRYALDLESNNAALAVYATNNQALSDYIVANLGLTVSYKIEDLFITGS